MFSFLRSNKGTRRKNPKKSSRNLRLETLEDRLVLDGGCIPPPPGLVGWWPGDGNAGDMVDGHPGTLVNGATFAPGKVAQAFSIPQPGAAVAIPSNSAIDFERTQPFSIDAWVRTADLGTEPDGFFTIFEKGEFGFPPDGAPSYGLALRPRMGNIDVWLQGSNNRSRIYWRGPVGVDVTGWHHYAMTYDGTSRWSGVRVYLDGRQLVPTYAENSLSTSIRSSSPGTIGAGFSYQVTEQFVAGFVDEVDMFNRVLSQSEIQAIYNAGSAGKCKGQTDIAATGLNWNTAQGGVDFSYKVSGADLTQDTTAAFYWSPGPTFDPNTASKTPYDTTIEHAVGDYGPYYVPNSVLGNPPDGTTNLLLVVDPWSATQPNGIITESTEGNFTSPGNNVKAMEIVTDTKMMDVTTTDFSTFTVKYSISDMNSPPFHFKFYQSADRAWSTDDTLRCDAQITDLQKFASGEHTVTFPLARIPVGGDQRFVIVVADPENEVKETVESNNEAFAIPLFIVGDKMNRAGDKGTSNISETDPAKASGPFTGAVLPGTADFYRLKRLDAAYTPDPGPWPFDFSLQTELPQFRIEDKLGQESLREPLQNLVRLIGQDSRSWQGATFSINEAYDSTGAHGSISLHYEGRAMDFQAFFGNSIADLGRFSGLAWLAGFDFVFLEPGGINPHVHASARASFATTIDQQSLQQGVEAALNLGYIKNQGIATSLSSKLDGLNQLMIDGDYIVAANRLGAFEHETKAQQGKQIDARFADRLLTNVYILEQELQHLLRSETRLGTSLASRSLLSDYQLAFLGTKQDSGVPLAKASNPATHKVQDAAPARAAQPKVARAAAPIRSGVASSRTQQGHSARKASLSAQNVDSAFAQMNGAQVLKGLALRSAKRV